MCKICNGDFCIAPRLGRIDATAGLTPNGNSYATRLVGDTFPSWEVIRYPRTVPLGSPARALIIATRDQTVVTDLKGSPQPTCTSGAPEHETPWTNPMSC
ncbi:hypothetical protein ACZ90_54050 [Streptomyces albus subsp. albus]|nr:hypothetical protein ACZ90_54050 [Streptomyces albus subsp. albus]